MDEHHWTTPHGCLLIMECISIELDAGRAHDGFVHYVWLCGIPIRICKSSLKFLCMCKLPPLANLANVDG